MKNKFLNVLFVILTILPLFFVIALITYLLQKDKKSKIEIRNLLLKIYFAILLLLATSSFLAAIISGQTLFIVIVSILFLIALLVIGLVVGLKQNNKRNTNKQEFISLNNENVGCEGDLIKDIAIPSDYLKRTTLANNIYFDRILIYKNKVVGYNDNRKNMTWYFRSYIGIDFVKANLNSQFAQIVFLTGFNSKNRAIGIDLFAEQNINAINDTNRILFCSGMFSFEKTNEFAEVIKSEISTAFENYQEGLENNNSIEKPSDIPSEILKYKQLLDNGVITKEEFEKKKTDLLNL